MSGQFIGIHDVHVSDQLTLAVVRGGGNGLSRTPIEGPGGQGFRLFVPEGGAVPGNLARIFADWLHMRPDADVFYGDEIWRDPSSGRRRHHCKPQFNLSMFVADDFVGLPLFVREQLLKQYLEERGQLSARDLYPLLLAAALRGTNIVGIPEFLLTYDAPYPRPGPTERIAMLDREFRTAGHLYRFTAGLTPTSVRMSKVFASHPPVTIVVPTNRSRDKANSNSRPHILNMLDSLATSTWPMDHLEVIVGDDQGTQGLYEGGDWPFKLTLVDTYNEEVSFNYARKMNKLWRMSRTDNVILMNDDLVVNSRDFIESLLTFSTEDGVGGSGACLVFPDGNYQHVGMVGGIFGVFAHPWYNRPPSGPKYGDWPLIHREYSAVTGAVFATRCSILDEVNGFDEFFSLDFNDVDLCLRMRLLGYRVVYTPFANLTHFESASRRSNFAPGDQILTFLSKWRDVIDDDPMYNPRLSRGQDEVLCHLDD